MNTDKMNGGGNVKKQKEPTDALWFHVRILYCLSLVCVVGVSVATWTCLSEVDKLRADFQGKVVRKGVAEFAMDAQGRSVNADDFSSNVPDKVVEEEEEVEEVPEEEEELLRVKRSGDVRDLKRRPSYYKHEAGSGMGDDWVWLTSYSRIPVRITRIIFFSISIILFSGFN